VNMISGAKSSISCRTNLPLDFITGEIRHDDFCAPANQIGPFDPYQILPSS
jgi:hypothetical protein